MESDDKRWEDHREYDSSRPISFEEELDYSVRDLGLEVEEVSDCSKLDDIVKE